MSPRMAKTKIITLRIKLEHNSWVYKSNAREIILKTIAEKGIFTAADRRLIPEVDTYKSTLDFMYDDGRVVLDEFRIENDIFHSESVSTEKEALIIGLETLVKNLRGYK